MKISVYLYLKRFCFVLTVLSAQLVQAQTDLADLVNPFIGTGGHGHTFPGATVPFGMVQLSPDTRIDGSWDGCSGYHFSDEYIYGFSHTHLSGTGVSDYGDIAVLPLVNLDAGKQDLKNIDYRNYKLKFSHDKETAKAGYYSVITENGIRAEMTATTRTGIHRYTFPKKGKHAILVQVDHRDETLESLIVAEGKNKIKGYRRSKSWANNQTIYFVMEFSCDFEVAEIVKDPEAKNEHARYAVLTFPRLKNQSLVIKTGVSTVNFNGAEKNLAAEAGNSGFDQLRENAKSAWNNELKKIEITGGTSDERIIFYTALYHTMIQPNVNMDVDGAYRGMDNKVHQAKDFTYYSVFSLWDTFRAAHPLYTIIDRKRTLDFIKTFLAHYQQGGRLPVWELASNETDCMIGYHSVSVITDAAVKGIDAFDQYLALEAMKKSANWNHLGIPAYIDHGFIAVEDEHESVSKTLEYAYDDWCIAQFAKMSGQQKDYENFIRRAQYWKNLFDPETGFMRPRKNGAWLSPFDPREVNNNYTEANSWQYSFFVLQDLYGLIAFQGGPKKFENKLDKLFNESTETTGREQADITGLIGQYAHGNEPSHHMAYLYNLVGQTKKSQDIIRKIETEFYKNSPDGLIGNEDCGQMSAWYVFSSMGFYPVCPGIPFYAVGKPVFSGVKIHLENGRTFSIETSEIPTDKNYVLAVNNTENFYISHADIELGNNIVFRMGTDPVVFTDNLITTRPFYQDYTNNEIIPVPYFEAESSVFHDSLIVHIHAQDENAVIYYTTDGSNPGKNTSVFKNEIVLHKSTTLKAVCITENGVSRINKGDFHRVGNHYQVQLSAVYNPQYNAGGPQGLVDGLRGDLNWRKGGWQGYQGQDFEAVIDLEKEQEVHYIMASFLQDTRSWIIFPTEVEYLISTDGKTFTPVAKLYTETDPKDERVMIENYNGLFEKQKARYIKVKAKNFGILPDWHLGKGGEAFIFIDEVDIR